MYFLCRLVTIAYLFLFLGCAKQPRNFFSFEDETPKQTVSRFQFPSVTEFSAVRDDAAIVLSWKALTHPQCVGYSLYRFSPLGFISKKPIAMLSRDETTWHDEQKSSLKVQYCVRGIFLCGDERVEGPSSALVGV